MKTSIKFLGVVLCAMVAVSAQAGSPPPGPKCPLSSAWVTSDTISAQGGLVLAMASSKSGVFAGGANAQQNLIRRSQDGGQSWKTVLSGGIPGATVSQVRGIADAGSHTLFSVENDVVGGKIEWVVRRSDDDGTSWAVTNTYSAGAGHSLQNPNGITVAPNGDVYVIGGDDNGGKFHWLTRRSVDRGVNFTTVDDFSGGIGYTIVAAPNGGIFSGGVFSDSVTKNGYWIGRYSYDGTTWAEGDRVLSGTNGGANGPQGSAVDRNGWVVFQGAIYNPTDNKFHWLTRLAGSYYPRSWQTIDDFTAGAQPDFAEGYGVTFSLDDEVFTTGTSHVGAKNNYVTRAAASPFSYFSQSDFLSSGGSTTGFAATTASSGEVFTGGQLAASDGSSQWIVRELRCAE